MRFRVLIAVIASLFVFSACTKISRNPQLQNKSASKGPTQQLPPSSEDGEDSEDPPLGEEFFNSPPFAGTDRIDRLEEGSSARIEILANDYDFEGDVIRVVSVGDPENGKATLVYGFTVSVRYEPDPEYVGEDSFTYTISDGEKVSVGTVIVNVVARNETLPPPVSVLKANNDVVVIDEDQTIEFTIGDTHPDNPFSNDTDTLDPTLSSVHIVRVTNPIENQLGLMSVSSDKRSLTYVPKPHHFGFNQVNYEIENAQGKRSEARISIIIRSVNDAPVAAVDEFEVLEKERTALFILENDSDPDTDDVSTIITRSSQIEVTQNPSNGTVTTGLSEGKPVLFYTSHSSQSDTLSYRITDGEAWSNVAEVTLNVRAVDSSKPGPIAGDDALSLNEDQAITFRIGGTESDNPFKNDSDPLDSTLASLRVVRVVNASENNLGDMRISDDRRSLSWAPKTNAFGTTQVDYEIENDSGKRALATIDIDIKSVNDVPSAVADFDVQAIEGEETPVNVLENDFDVETSKADLKIEIVKAPHNGQATVATREGREAILYTSENAEDTTLTYRISDGEAWSNVADVTLEVTPKNQPPIANPDTFRISDAGEVILDLLANDRDPEEDALKITTLSFGAGVAGTFRRIDNDTALSYTPPKGSRRFSGSYSIEDTEGNVASANLSITVTAEGTPPPPPIAAPIARDDVIELKEDDSEQVYAIGGNEQDNPFRNDSDLREPSLRVTAITLEGADPVGTVKLLAGNRSVSYEPLPNRHGTDTATYTLTNDSGETSQAKIQFIVESVNDVPVAMADTDPPFLVKEDETALLDVLKNDSDADVDKIETVISSLEITLAPKGDAKVVTVNGKPMIEYTPLANSTETDILNYRISDGTAWSSSAPVNINIRSENDRPLAEPDNHKFVYVVNDGKADPTVLNVLANDSDPDKDPLEIITVTKDTGFLGEIVIQNNARELKYTPPGDLSESKEIGGTYTVTDGALEATASFTIQVDYRYPTAGDDVIRINEDETVTFSLNGNEPNNPFKNDSDPNYALSSLKVTMTSNKEGGIGNLSFTNDSLRFRPDANQSGTHVARYKLQNPEGFFDWATLTIQVDPVNDTPVALQDECDAKEDLLSFCDVLKNDTDPDGDSPQEIEITQAPEFGTAKAETVEGQLGVTYLSDADSDRDDTLTYRYSDGELWSEEVTVSIKVASENDPPTANPDSLFVSNETRDGAVIEQRLPVLNNDVDPEDGRLRVVEVEPESTTTGTFEIPEGGDHIRYTPDPSFDGVAKLKYTIEDSLGARSETDVVITVVLKEPLRIEYNGNDITNNGWQDPIKVVGEKNEAPIQIQLNLKNLATRTITISDVFLYMNPGPAAYYRISGGGRIEGKSNRVVFLKMLTDKEVDETPTLGSGGPSIEFQYREQDGLHREKVFFDVEITDTGKERPERGELLLTSGREFFDLDDSSVFFSLPNDTLHHKPLRDVLALVHLGGERLLINEISVSAGFTLADKSDPKTRKRKWVFELQRDVPSLNPGERVDIGLSRKRANALGRSTGVLTIRTNHHQYPDINFAINSEVVAPTEVVSVSNRAELRTAIERSRVSIELTQDIDLENAPLHFAMTGSGVNKKGFEGDLDGKGFSLRNVAQLSPGGVEETPVGLFEKIEGTVRNLNVVSPSAQGVDVAVLAETLGSYGVLENIHVSGAQLHAERHAGGFALFLMGQIIDSSFEGLVSAGENAELEVGFAGGMFGRLGYPYDVYSMEPKIISGRVNGTVTSKANYVGGVGGTVNTGGNGGDVGIIYAQRIDRMAPFQIEKTKVDAEIRGADYVGGLLGGTNYREEILLPAQGTVADCFATGSVLGKLYVGGLIGNLYSTAQVLRSRSEMNVTGKEKVGGAFGMVQFYRLEDENGPERVAVRSTSASGLVKGVTKFGGFVGEVGIGEPKPMIQDAYFQGRVETKRNQFGNPMKGSFIGGFVGFITRKIGTGRVHSIKNAYTVSEIGAPPKSTDVGGFLGGASQVLFANTVEGAFWATDVGRATSAGDPNKVKGLTSTQMTQRQRYIDAGYDEAIWQLGGARLPDFTSAHQPAVE